MTANYVFHIKGLLSILPKWITEKLIGLQWCTWLEIHGTTLILFSTCLKCYTVAAQDRSGSCLCHIYSTAKSLKALHGLKTVLQSHTNKLTYTPTVPELLLRSSYQPSCNHLATTLSELWATKSLRTACVSVIQLRGRHTAIALQMSGWQCVQLFGLTFVWSLDSCFSSRWVWV